MRLDFNSNLRHMTPPFKIKIKRSLAERNKLDKQKGNNRILPVRLSAGIVLILGPLIATQRRRREQNISQTAAV